MRRPFGASPYASERETAMRLRAEGNCESCGHPARYPGERFCTPCLASHLAMQKPVSRAPRRPGVTEADV